MKSKVIKKGVDDDMMIVDACSERVSCTILRMQGTKINANNLESQKFCTLKISQPMK